MPCNGSFRPPKIRSPQPSSEPEEGDDTLGEVEVQKVINDKDHCLYPVKINSRDGESPFVSGMEEELRQLAELVRTRNEIDHQISHLLGRPATVGNIGEFVASRVFAIKLSSSGSQAGYDGVFTSGPLAGKRVNIKAYSRHEGILDISPHPCDYYLVLAGPTGPARKLPWVIEAVFLFEVGSLLAALRERGVKIGVATSVRRHLWEAARVYPPHDRAPVRLSLEQQELLALFAVPVESSLQGAGDPEGAC
jgi:hypothetical protein